MLQQTIQKQKTEIDNLKNQLIRADAEYLILKDMYEKIQRDTMVQQQQQQQLNVQ